MLIFASGNKNSGHGELQALCLKNNSTVYLGGAATSNRIDFFLITNVMASQKIYVVIVTKLGDEVKEVAIKTIMRGYKPNDFTTDPLNRITLTWLYFYDCDEAIDQLNYYSKQL